MQIRLAAQVPPSFLPVPHSSHPYTLRFSSQGMMNKSHYQSCQDRKHATWCVTSISQRKPAIAYGSNYFPSQVKCSRSLLPHSGVHWWQTDRQTSTLSFDNIRQRIRGDNVFAWLLSGASCRYAEPARKNLVTFSASYLLGLSQQTREIKPMAI